MMRREFLQSMAGAPIAATALAQAFANPQAGLDALDRADSDKLLGFIRRGWHILEPETRKFADGWAVGAITEHLEAVSHGQITRLLVNVPPGSMKSMTTNVFYPAWEWGPRHRPDKRFISWSYSQDLTIRDNRRARNLIVSPWYERNWGDQFSLVDDQNAKVKFENDKQGWKIASSVGGVGVGERGDVLVIDDPHNIMGGESEVIRGSVLLWFTEVVPTRLNDPDRSAIVVIMQRVHEADVSGLIIAQELGYEHLMLPMEYEADRRCFTCVPNTYAPQRMRYLAKRQQWVPDTWTPTADETDQPIVNEHAAAPTRTVYLWDQRSEDGELLWPERFPMHVVERDKKVLSSVGGSYAVAGQFQQRPVSRTGGLFQREWFSKFVKERPPARAYRIRYWDKAGTQDGGAWSAGVLMSEWEGAYYVEDVVRGQWSSFARNDVIFQTAKLDGPDVRIWVEQEPGSGGKESAEISIRELAGFNARKEPVTGDKVTRAGPLAAQCEIHNVILVEGQWNQVYIDEIAMFPNGKYKDQVDASSGAFNKLKLAKTGGGSVDVKYG